MSFFCIYHRFGGHPFTVLPVMAIERSAPSYWRGSPIFKQRTR
eukprot:gene25751-34330_t